MTKTSQADILVRMDALTLRDPRVIAALVVSATLIGVVSASSPLVATFGLLAIVALAVAWIDTRIYIMALIAATPLFDVGVIVVGPVDVQFMEIGWAIAFMVLVIRHLVARPVEMAKVPLWVVALLGIVVLWEGAAAQVSVEPVRSIVEVGQTAYLAAVMCVVASVVGAFDARDRVRLAIASAWGFLGVTAVSAGWQYALEQAFPRVIVDSSGITVAGGPLKIQAAGAAAITVERFGLANIGPVASAAVFVVVLVFSAAALLDKRAAQYRALSLAVALVSGIGLLLTYSRAGWLVGVVALWLLSVRAGPRKMIVLTLALVMLVSVASTLPAVSARLQEFTDFSEGSFAVHVRMWVTAIWMTVTRPLTGWGPGVFKQIAPGLNIGTEYWPHMANQDAHNFVLQTSAESGVVGAGAILAFLLGLHATTLRTLVRRGGILAISPWVAAFSVLLMDLTLNTFRTEVTWVTLGILLAAFLWTDDRDYTALPAELDGV